MPGRNGGTLRRGGNKTPGPGRPPDAWKAACRGLVSWDETLKAAQSIVVNQKHPAWVGAMKFLADHGYGRPQESVDVTSGGKPLERQVLVWGGKRVEF
jgi:hypothetical protein